MEYPSGSNTPQDLSAKSSGQMSYGIYAAHRRLAAEQEVVETRLHPPVIGLSGSQNGRGNVSDHCHEGERKVVESLWWNKLTVDPVLLSVSLGFGFMLIAPHRHVIEFSWRYP